MNVKLQSRHLAISQSLQNLIDRRAQKARKMLPTFRSHDLDLHLTIEKLSKGKQYQTTLVLTTPQTAIRVDDIEEAPTRSVVRAFDELLRKIKKFKSRLNRERYWQREVGAVGKVTPVNQLQEVEGAINENLEKVENYIRRELFHRALIDHFPPGVIQPQALVDQVFLDVSSRVESKPVNLSIDQWMFQVARDIVNDKIQELEDHREEAHIEEPSRERERWEDEILNFYQPDEVLKLEDLIEDNHGTSPEELLAKEEMEEKVQKIIAQLDPSVRESFVLFALEGFNSDEVAMITGKRPAEVLKDVDVARKHLRQQLSV